MNKVIAIVGSRNYPRLDQVAWYVEQLAPSTVVVSGAGGAVDLKAAACARARGLHVIEYPADWGNLHVAGAVMRTKPDGTRYNVMAGFQRNSLIVTACTHVVAFWDGKSQGTLDTLTKARGQRKPCWVFDVLGEWSVYT